MIKRSDLHDIRACRYDEVCVQLSHVILGTLQIGYSRRTASKTTRKFKTLIGREAVSAPYQCNSIRRKHRRAPPDTVDKMVHTHRLDHTVRTIEDAGLTPYTSRACEIPISVERARQRNCSSLAIVAADFERSNECIVFQCGNVIGYNLS